MQGFTIMYKDTPVIHLKRSLELEDSRRLGTIFSEILNPDIKPLNIPNTFYNPKCSFRDIISFASHRVVEQGRVNVNYLYRMWDLDYRRYDRMVILRKTHGASHRDFTWVLFDGEPAISFEEIRKNTIEEPMGAQQKYWDGNRLIKLNTKHKESRIEYITSIIGEALGLPIVKYKKGSYKYHNKVYNGCECESFLSETAECTSLKDIINYFVPKDNATLENIIRITSEYTNIPESEIGERLELRGLFYYLIKYPYSNFTNVAFIRDNGVWTIAPFFNHGRAFDTQCEMEFTNKDFAKAFLTDERLKAVEDLQIPTFYKETVLSQVEKLCI